MPGSRHERFEFTDKIVASLGEAVIAINSSGLVVYANSAAEALLEFCFSENEDIKFSDLIAHPLARDLPRTFQQVLESDEPVTVDGVQLNTKAGGKRTVALNLAAMTAVDGERHLVCAIRDVTVQADLQDTILESRNKFRAALDSTSAWVVFVDREKTIVAANRSFAYHLGVSVESMVGKKCHELMLAQVCGENCPAEEVLLLGKPCHRKIVVWSELFQENRILSVTASPYVDEVGGISGVAEIMLDVTREHRQQEEIDYLKQLNEDIVQNAPMGIFATDEFGNLTTCNAAWGALVGAESGTPSIGANIDEFLAMQKSGIAAEILKRLADGQTFQIENMRLNHSDGKQFMVSVTTIPLIDGSGRVEGMVGLMEDVTPKWQADLQIKRYSSMLEQKVVERTAEANEARRFLEAVIDTVENGIFTVDLEGRITSFNASAERITGHKAGDVVGSHCRSIWSDSCGECWLTAHDFDVASRQQACRIPARNGASLTLLKSAALLCSESGEVVGVVESFVDITERERLRQELEQSLNQTLEVHAELQRLSKIKDDFIASVSHELRSPIGAIKTFIDLLLNYPEEGIETKVEFLGIIQKETGRLSRLINDLLDFSQLRAGRTRLRLTNTNIAQLVDNTIKLFSVEAEEKRIKVECINNLGRVSDLEIDSDRIEQVFANLLSNALKFTPPGGKVTVCLEGQPSAKRPVDKDARVLLSVADTGSGIPPGQLSSIFEEFTQVTLPAEGKPKGLGLGLPICKSIVELHGGRIWVESEETKGSVFKVELPIRRVPSNVLSGARV